MTIQETVRAIKALRAPIPEIPLSEGLDATPSELPYAEGLDWYYALVDVGNDAIANYNYEELGFYEDWRRDVKRVMV